MPVLMVMYKTFLYLVFEEHGFGESGQAGVVFDNYRAVYDALNVGLDGDVSSAL